MGEKLALGWKSSTSSRHMRGQGGNSRRRELLGVGRRNSLHVSGSGVFIVEKCGSLLVKACLWGLDTWKKQTLFVDCCKESLLMFCCHDAQIANSK